MRKQGKLSLLVTKVKIIESMTLQQITLPQVIVVRNAMFNEINCKANNEALREDEILLPKDETCQNQGRATRRRGKPSGQFARNYEQQAEDEPTRDNVTTPNARDT